MRNPNPEENQPLKVSEQESAEASLKTEGGLEYYQRYLQLTSEDLKGKEILDLGSGPTNLFAIETQKKFPDTNVVSLDASYDESKLELRGTLLSDIPRTKTRIEKKICKKEHCDKYERARGLFTQLPFMDESFDLVVSSGAMPLYLTDKNQITKAFKEVIRVLRKGGKAHIGPITYTDIIDRDYTKNISLTHRQHSREESRNLFDGILLKLRRQIDFMILPAVEDRPYSPYSKIFSPPVLVICKKNAV